MKKVKKAIFPVGGLGTRFLPATKALPKEMLPIVDKPLIQYAVEEAAAAGIEEFIFVTGRNKNAIEDHFDHSFELEYILNQKARHKEISDLEAIMFKAGSVVYTRQQKPLGLGHAVWCARHFIHDEPFAVLLADDFIDAPVPCLKQMVAVYEQTQANILAIMNVLPEQVNRYGIIQTSDKTVQAGQCVKVEGVIEKPTLAQAPSTLAVVGRYILDARIFSFLEQQERGVGGEIQLTDAFAPLLKEQEFCGYAYAGTRFDCGAKAGYINANIQMALKRSDLKDEVERFIKSSFNLG
jgi:UTP--glucose-1-phosphate uridylyltransferase